jgi:predicted RNase H-like nuclease (RuvC/YqgF family)
MMSDSEIYYSAQPRTNVRNSDSRALALVHQAADVIKDIEEHAKETEVHYQSLVRQALDRLQVAEDRVKLLETDCQMLDSELAQAKNIIENLEAKLNDAESRLTTSEAELTETKQRAEAADNALDLVEEAIRTQLLTAARRSPLKTDTAA